jgi:CheY-like chemotaxis protein/anti-sigma regulatory factor (Ser/Thr protein kinase)
MQHSNHILVVDDSPSQLCQIKMVLEGEGFNVRVVARGDLALASIRAELPTLVITDLQMPHTDGFELIAAVHKLSPTLPVIVTTAQGTEETIAKVLRHGASSYVPQRDIESELIPVVRQVMSINEISMSVRRVAKFAVESSIRLCLESDESLIPSVIARLELPLVELDLFDEGERMQMAMALDESLTNAIIHGNLEVSSDLREIENGDPYAALIRQRKTQPPYCDRKVMVSLHATTEQASVTIRDEGPGFDQACLRDPTDPDNLELCGGRGLMLIHAFVDSVAHNQKGNEITLIKRKASDSQHPWGAGNR